MKIPNIFILAVISGLLFFSYLPAHAKDGDWEQIEDHDGIQCFKKEIPGSDLMAFKGQGIVDAPIAKLIRIMLDTKRGDEWIDSLVEAHQVRKISDNEYLEYDHFRTPPIVMKDRDFLIYGKVVLDKAAKTFILDLHSVVDPEVPETNYVRADLKSSSFNFRSIDGGKRTYVIAEINLDPKGSVPKWIVNMFQNDWPMNTLTSLRKQAAKADITEDPYYKDYFKQDPATPSNFP